MSKKWSKFVSAAVIVLSSAVMFTVTADAEARRMAVAAALAVNRLKLIVLQLLKHLPHQQHVQLRRQPRVPLPVLQQLHNARVCHVFWVQSLVLRRV